LYDEIEITNSPISLVEKSGIEAVKAVIKVSKNFRDIAGYLSVVS
jgi:hypothetical protein